MPKYFSDERKLPFPKAALFPSNVNAEKIKELLGKHSSLSLSIVFEGFEKQCLGYLIHVRKHGKRYELLNIVDEVQMIVQGEEQLAAVLRHVSGIEYSEEVQAAFHQIRNDIGKGSIFAVNNN